ncbi:ricin-type beta-trefoil lectin domain protein [Streptomyces sp. NPDC058611]|uniref:ricin-type beta-trefoil lectin domain protein n=1 Tax=Streptomyces sp. NPDC058611 TaxID=3346554 RepID=UPI003669C5F9
MAISRARKALFTGLVGGTAALAGIASLGVAYAGPQSPAAASAAEMPFAVEDFSYPDAARILADQKITLKRGDGHIVFVDCAAGTPDITVKSRIAQKNFCFDVVGNKGWLTLELPDAFGIWTEAHPVQAKITADGQETVVNAPANDYKPFGEAGDASTPSVLVELRVTNGPSAPQTPDAALAHTGVINIGNGKRACTATLVDTAWVATSKSCFSDQPDTGTDVVAGAPKDASSATFGTHVSEIVDLVPRDDRDLVLARLAKPAYQIAPLTVSGTAPTAGETLTVTGYGRTKTDWRPSTQHKATFNVSAPTATTFDITPNAPADATVCQGDAGGPALRTENGKAHLAAIVSRASTKGCLGSAATAADASAIRMDGLTSWITSAKARPVILKAGQTLHSGEMLVSENAKLIMQADGNLVIYHVTGGEGRGAALWTSGTGGNPGAWAKMQADGNFVVYKKDGKEGDGSTALWASNTHNNGSRLELQGDANLVVYTKDGGHLWHSDTYPRGDRLASGAKLTPGQWLTNGKQALIMDIQGNVHVREIATGRELWSKITWEWYSYLHMQADGNLVLYKKNTGNGTGALWATGTQGGNGSYATLDNHGSLTVRWKEGGPRWGSLSLRGVQSNRCLDFDGTNATIWDCWGGANQQWDYTPAKELRIDGNKCLTAETGAPQSSRAAALPCDGRAEQKWNYNGTTITSAVKPDQCVNVFSEGIANGSAVGLWQCGTGNNTKWVRL